MKIDKCACGFIIVTLPGGSHYCPKCWTVTRKYTRKSI